MNLETAADTAARAWLDAVRMLAGTQHNGFFRRTPGGTAELITGAPFPALNGVAAISRKPSAEEISEFSDSPRLREVPWTIHVRGDAIEPEVVAVADDHGLAKRLALPLMVRELTEEDAAEVPGARRISAADGLAYQRTMAAGFEAPEPLFAIFADPAVIDMASGRAYLVEVDGVPVATAFGLIAGDVVGVFNIAVPPAFRRKGYGRRATAAVLRDAYRDGVRTAFLHSSVPGMPLYLDMGFQVAENWSVFSANPAT
ncbi:GNAT family N-acetyltransferase [Actinoplanes sp. LDG1-06]|uniref:GNAT family N-acetyltransferase n=1 Tax=Paractinoplanes ovalisporus TaxID=2810368 RepID=A0ABS2ASB2_9ACTN|nr:GNAT family N-acetyltransferase [Actinoplanes ovalisporus]MBM2622752.1 GNAT family N-acetyltransferase [Actinoplanes ovalisporus]